MLPRVDAKKVLVLDIKHLKENKVFLYRTITCYNDANMLTD